MESEGMKRTGSWKGGVVRSRPVAERLSLLPQFGFTKASTGMPGVKFRILKRKRQ